MRYGISRARCEGEKGGEDQGIYVIRRNGYCSSLYDLVKGTKLRQYRSTTVFSRVSSSQLGSQQGQSGFSVLIRWEVAGRRFGYYNNDER